MLICWHRSGHIEGSINSDNFDHDEARETLPQQESCQHCTTGLLVLVSTKGLPLLGTTLTLYIQNTGPGTSTVPGVPRFRAQSPEGPSWVVSLCGLRVVACRWGGVAKADVTVSYPRCASGHDMATQEAVTSEYIQGS